MIQIIGDKMLLYDRDNDLFFAGYGKKNYTKPKWSKSLSGAMVINRLSYAYMVKEQLGLGVRIISATEARKINALREYREAQNGEQPKEANL